MTDRGWALVTGGSRRIGRALALAAAGAGHDIIIHARSATQAEEAAQAARRLGRRAEILVADLADAAACAGLIAAAPTPLP
jgi:NAD(P)-dependent dehydrogenase (short-subunit alcohol dehydrogenase family)